jgi:hypothetical protein
MNKVYLSFLVLLSFSSFAQSDKKANDFKFSQFELALPIKYNPDHSEENTTWFVPNGIVARYGYGVDYDETFGISLHTGLDFKGKQKVVNVPVFANLRFSPEIGESTNVVFEYGVGKAFALGRGDLSGVFQRYKLGLVSQMKAGLFVEYANYGYKINNEQLRYLSVGFTVYVH